MVAVLLSDLLGSTVLDADGRELGPLQDVRARRDAGEGRLKLHSIVVGGHRLAHSFGYVEGRTTGPWLLRRLVTSRGGGEAAIVPVRMVADWNPPVRLSVAARDLPQSTDEQTP